MIDLPPQPQQSDEFETLNTMLGDTVDCDVVMNFSSVEMLTSESICGLLILAKLLGGAGHELVLCGLPPAINDIFVRTGLLSVFTFADTQAEALARVQGDEVSCTGA